MKLSDLKIGDIVYHKEVYNHKEPLKILGVTEIQILLEGDYSGGTHNVIQKSWMPLHGLSRIYNHSQKYQFRRMALDIEELAKPITDRKQSPELEAMFDLLHAVLVLTNDITPLSTEEGEFIKI